MSFKSLLLILVSVWLGISSECLAQPLFPHAFSIECLMANADHAVIGKFEKIHKQENDITVLIMTIDETLKMPMRYMYDEKNDAKRVAVRLPTADNPFSEWVDRSSRVIVFLDELRPQNSSAFELKASGMEMMNSDGQLLRDSESVVQTARSAELKRQYHIERVHTFKLRVDREAVKATTWEPYYESGGHLVLEVPADENLQRRVIQYLASDDWFQRYQGVEGLRFFKSEDNINRLKALLADPHFETDDASSKRIYHVRNVAYNVLLMWKVPVDKPIIEEGVK